MPLTYRKLAWMAYGKREADWCHTAALMALIANVNRDPKQRREPYRAEEFHPHYQRKPVEEQEKVSALEWVKALGESLAGRLPPPTEDDVKPDVVAERKEVRHGG